MLGYRAKNVCKSPITVISPGRTRTERFHSNAVDRINESIELLHYPTGLRILFVGNEGSQGVIT